MWIVLIGMHSCLARTTVSQQYLAQNLREMHTHKQRSSVQYYHIPLISHNLFLLDGPPIPKTSEGVVWKSWKN